MSIPLTINGATFEYPVDFDENWGVEATGWAQAVTNGMLQRAGGSFPLMAQVDFGTSFGIKVKSVVSETVNPATAGYIALAKTDAIEWRNNANNANLALAIDSGDNLTFNGSPISLTSLTNTHIFVGNVSNIPVDVALSGDATITNTGVLTIANGAITDAKVNASAAIALTKLAATTPSVALVSNGSGFVSPSAVTSTELGFSSGVTSSIQTQLNNRLQLTGGTLSGVLNMGSNKITALSNGTVATDAATFGQIKVIQTVFSASGITGSSTATSLFSIVSVSITPTSVSSRFFITASMPLTSSSTSVVGATIARNGTNLATANSPVHQGFALTSSPAYMPCAMSYIDSPATLSPIVYELATFSDGSTSVGLLDGVATITVMEIV